MKKVMFSEKKIIKINTYDELSEAINENEHPVGIEFTDSGESEPIPKGLLGINGKNDIVIFDLETNEVKILNNLNSIKKENIIFTESYEEFINWLTKSFPF